MEVVIYIKNLMQKKKFSPPSSFSLHLRVEGLYKAEYFYHPGLAQMFGAL